MPVRCLSFLCVVLAVGGASCQLALPAGVEPSSTYVPDPEIEKLIEQATKADKLAARNAFERLAGFGGAAERALQSHLQRETDAAARARFSELLARLNRGKVGYRITIELQPDGSGLLTLWSDRALLAQCGKDYARLLGETEPQFDDEELRRNVYSKGELFDFLSDGIKSLESRVEARGQAVEAVGLLSFKNFDALAGFAEKFDTAGYYLLSGVTLTDSPSAVRTYRFRKPREDGQQARDKNLLLFHGVLWELTLDFKGKITSSNAPRTDGSKLVWTFNCSQMVNGQAQIEASYDAAGLPPRLPKEDRALPLPTVVQANQPIAAVRHVLIRAKVFKPASALVPEVKVLRERNQLVELDGRDSLPHGADLQYRWTQTFGEPLNINPSDLAQPRVCLIVKEPGEYRFDLVVSANGVFSKPVEVKVLVEDDAPPAPPKAAETAAAGIGKEPPPAAPRTAPATEQKPPRKTVVDPAKAKELLAQGMKPLKFFQYAEAKRLLNEAFALNPNDQECQFNLGVALMECGDLPAACAKFEDLAAGTTNFRAMMYVGHCLARMESYSEAGQWYRRGGKLGKEQVAWEPRWQLGNIALAKKDYENALRLLADAEKSATEANVKDYRLFYDLARALHARQRDREALVRLNALLELGYTPDAQLVADIRNGARAAVAATPVEPPPVEPPKVTETAKPPTPERKTDTAVKPVAPPPVEPAKEPRAPARAEGQAGEAPAAPKPPTPERKTDTAVKPVAPPPVEPPKVTETAKPPTPDAGETPAVRPPMPGAGETPAVRPPTPGAGETPAVRPPKATDTAPADVVDLTKVDLTKPQPVAPPAKTEPNAEPKSAPKSTEAPTPVARTEPKKTAPPVSQPEPEKTPPPKKAEGTPRGEPKKATAANPEATATPVGPAAPAPKKAAPKTEPAPAAPKPPLPPVPEDFEQALAAGKRACAEAVRFSALSTPEGKAQAARACDEAEAMLQGAWAKKPGDDNVMAAFRELAKCGVPVIAIPRNPFIKAKARGLVALDAEPSLRPKGRPLYCVWEQVAGEPLNLRPEDLSQPKVGIRIPRPGTYKFELVISDGGQGGNPVTVTVEVAE